MAFLAPRPVNEAVISDDKYSQPALITKMFNCSEIALHNLIATHGLQLFIVTQLVNQIVKDYETVPFSLWKWHIAMLHIYHRQQSISRDFPLRSEPFAALFGNTKVGRISCLVKLPLTVNNIRLQVFLRERQGHAHP